MAARVPSARASLVISAARSSFHKRSKGTYGYPWPTNLSAPGQAGLVCRQRGDLGRPVHVVMREGPWAREDTTGARCRHSTDTPWPWRAVL